MTRALHICCMAPLTRGFGSNWNLCEKCVARYKISQRLLHVNYLNHEDVSERDFKQLTIRYL